MAVTVTGQGKFVQTGSEYYAVINAADPFKSMLEVGYSTGSVTRSLPIITASFISAVNPAAAPLLAVSGEINEVPFTRSELEVFLMALYLYGASFDDGDEDTSLYLESGNPELGFATPSSMSEAGRLNDFASLNLADFCVLTGARERLYLEKSTNLTKDIFTLGPLATRPTAVEVAKTEAGNDKMLSTIRHLGVPGILKYLYAGGWISLQEFGDETVKQCPVFGERQIHVSQIIVPFLRSQGTAILTKSEIKAAFQL